jgi:hypothetical protein
MRSRGCPRGRDDDDGHDLEDLEDLDLDGDRDLHLDGDTLR